MNNATISMPSVPTTEQVIINLAKDCQGSGEAMTKMDILTDIATRALAERDRIAKVIDSIIITG
jgi:hypothetical protein